MKLTNRAIEKNIKHDLRRIHASRRERTPHSREAGIRKYLICAVTAVTVILSFLVSYRVLESRTKTISDEILFYQTDKLTKPGEIDENRIKEVITDLEAEKSRLNNCFYVSVGVFAVALVSVTIVVISFAVNDGRKRIG